MNERNRTEKKTLKFFFFLRNEEQIFSSRAPIQPVCVLEEMFDILAFHVAKSVGKQHPSQRSRREKRKDREIIPGEFKAQTGCH